MQKHSAIHWPDHCLGKRESRRIRDAHNALYNAHAKLIADIRQAIKRKAPGYGRAETCVAEIVKLANEADSQFERPAQTVMHADPDAFANVEPPAVSPTLDR